jgi:flagellar biosynthetic protein FliQ
VNQQTVIDISNKTIFAATEIAVPLLMTALVVGLVISVFQAATQINEATLSFLPKIAAIIVVIALISPWMVRRMTDFTQNVYGQITQVARNK